MGRWEDGHAPPWCPDDEYASEVLFDVISSRSTLSGPGNDGQRFSHRHWEGGLRKGHDSLLVEDRRRAGRVPELWRLFLQSSLTALG